MVGLGVSSGEFRRLEETSFVSFISFRRFRFVSSITESPVISSYFRLSYFGHRCMKLDLVLISILTGKYSTGNLKDVCKSSLRTC